MDYRKFTNDSLLMIYASIRGALASDDAQRLAMEQPRFAVRETVKWKEHAVVWKPKCFTNTSRGALRWHDIPLNNRQRAINLLSLIHI